MSTSNGKQIQLYIFKITVSNFFYIFGINYRFKPRIVKRVRVPSAITSITFLDQGNAIAAGTLQGEQELNELQAMMEPLLNEFYECSGSVLVYDLRGTSDSPLTTQANTGQIHALSSAPASLKKVRITFLPITAFSSHLNATVLLGRHLKIILFKLQYWNFNIG
jgi:hypothetical protein